MTSLISFFPNFHQYPSPTKTTPRFRHVSPCFMTSTGSKLRPFPGMQADAAGGRAGLHRGLRLRLQPAHRRGHRRANAAVDAAPGTCGGLGSSGKKRGWSPEFSGFLMDWWWFLMDVCGENDDLVGIWCITSSTFSRVEVRYLANVIGAALGEYIIIYPFWVRMPYSTHINHPHRKTETMIS